MTAPLMLHQRDDVDWWHLVERGLLANEPGLGKTRSAIEATQHCRNVLVVAPAGVHDAGVWEDELQLWADRPESYLLASYHSVNAREARRAKSGSRMVSIPTDDPRPELKHEKWDAIILDEAHAIKGRDTHWTKALYALGRRVPQFLAMTGTPIPNWSHEIFTTLRMIFPKEAPPGQRYGSFWRWAEEWFNINDEYGMRVLGLRECTKKCEIQFTLHGQACQHYRVFTKDNLGKHYRRIWRNDVLDLPPLTDQDILTPMEPKQAKVYRDLKKRFVSEVDGHEVIAWNQGSLNQLLDLCTVSDWFIHPAGEPRGGKLERLRLDLSGRSRATLVFCTRRVVAEACAEVARSLGMTAHVIHGGIPGEQRGQMIREFKAGLIDVLVGTYGTMSEAMTLTVASEALFVEQSWMTYKTEQAKRRLHRIGQTHPVTCRHYITPSSVDQNKRKWLVAKTVDQVKTMTAAQYTSLL